VTVPQRSGSTQSAEGAKAAPSGQGVGVHVEQVVVVGRGSIPPGAVSSPKVAVADQATLLAAPRGEAIPVTPPHGTRLPERETQLFGSMAVPAEGSGSGEVRDSEEKVTIMLPGPGLPSGIVPEVPPTDPHGHAAFAAAADPDQPLFTLSAQARHWPVPDGRAGETEAIPSSRRSSGPSMVGLILIGFGLLVVSAVVTWAIVSF